MQDAGSAGYKYGTGYRVYRIQVRYRMQGLQDTSTVQDTGSTGYKYGTGCRVCRIQVRYRMQGLQDTSTVQDAGSTGYRDATVHSALAAKSNASAWSESVDMSDTLLYVYCLGFCSTGLGEASCITHTIFSAIEYALGLFRTAVLRYPDCCFRDSISFASVTPCLSGVFR